MALVVIRGAVQGELAENVAVESIGALIVFYLVGWMAAWVMDSMIRDSIETAFRKRVDWYQKGLVEAGLVESKTTETDSPGDA